MDDMRMTQLEKKVNDIHKMLVGNGQLGLFAKVEIMWAYRLLFVSAIIANLIGAVFIFFSKGGG